jgi:hypothetical protein
MLRKAVKKRILYIIIIVFGCTWLTLHYLIIVLQLLPANPITILNSKPISKYVDPFFEQNWRMFAPEPPLANRILLIQLNVKSQQDPDTQLTDWFDVSTALLHKMQSNPFSPAVTRYRTIDGIFGSYVKISLRAALDSNYEYSALDLHSTRLFNRLLVVLAKELYKPEYYSLVAVRGRILFEEIPPFSKFQSKSYKTEVLNAITSDWFFFDATEK